ncbi:DUF2269 family protein [Streptomyces armeniacus]|uniref:DUF2269 family protein n=1 Tax=Streptomyces armeniacus TaxID=83291 RepID=A0A345XSA2_9ACTN|nr:DUF2269 family protein [Streptomyces armeniacus]AXK34518.1 DUF2269 family protein [Streptomyces armeniacus]
MTKFLLAVHVLAAILAIGPVAVAASMFPAALRRAAPEAGPAAAADPQGVAVVRTLHRICRVYVVIGIVVPVFGFATASSLGVLGDAWLITSIVLTAVAAAVLVLCVLPGQEAALARLTGTDADAGADSDPDGDPGGADADTAAPPPTPTAIRTPTVSVSRTAARLGMYTGVFNLLWAIVTVLMIVRPGSTTGA